MMNTRETVRETFEQVSAGALDLREAVAMVLENDMARTQRLRSVKMRAIAAQR